MRGDASTALEPENNDTIASLDGARSVGDNNDAETVELLCALTADDALLEEQKDGREARQIG